MVDISYIFILVGLFLGIGFLADLVFEKTGIPDLLIMIFLGILVGPIFGLIDRSTLISTAPSFAALAVAVILFDAGLNLRLQPVLSQSPRALVLAFVGVATTIIVTSIFTSLVLGWNIIDGILLGTVIGGSSSAVVIPLISRVNASPKIVTLLSLESVFTDAVVVVVAIFLMQFLSNPIEAPSVILFTRGIAGAFMIGGVVGALVGLGWIRLLRTISEESYRDVLTLGIALMVYGFSESIGGSGAISTLVFGLVLGNGVDISLKLGIKGTVEASVIMRRFQRQISFLIRTFFFVFLGMILVITSVNMMLIGIIIAGLLIVARYFTVWVSTLGAAVLQVDRPIMTVMMGRGLAAAVLANLAGGYGLSIAPVLQEITLEIIIITVIITAVGIHLPKLLRSWNNDANEAGAQYA